MKVLVFGEGPCGKTSLLRAIEGYDNPLARRPTLGVEFSPAFSSRDAFGNREIICWDATGLPQHYPLVPMYMRCLDLALYCIDLSNPISEWEGKVENPIRELKKLSPGVLIYLVCTKSDLSSDLSSINGIRGHFSKVFVTSALTRDGVSELKAEIVSLIPKPKLSDYSGTLFAGSSSKERTTESCMRPQL